MCVCVLVSCVKCSCHCESAVNSATVTPTSTSVVSWSAHVSSWGSCVQRFSLQVCLVSRRLYLSSAFHAIWLWLPRLYRDLPTLPGTNPAQAAVFWILMLFMMQDFQADLLCSHNWLSCPTSHWVNFHGQCKWLPNLVFVMSAHGTYGISCQHLFMNRQSHVL